MLDLCHDKRAIYLKYHPLYCITAVIRNVSLYPKPYTHSQASIRLNKIFANNHSKSEFIIYNSLYNNLVPDTLYQHVEMTAPA